MRELSSYLKRHMVMFVNIALIFVMQSIFLFLIQANANDITYLIVIEIFIVLVVLTIDFYRYHHRIAELTVLTKQVASADLQFPIAEDLMEELYQNMIEDANMNRLLILAREAKTKQDMMDYYSMWVHQVKTPIAGMQLMMQIQQEDELMGDLLEQLQRISQYVDMALQYQRINADGNDYVLKKVSVDEVIRDVIHRFAKQMIRKDLKLVYEGCNCEVLTDSKWLRFVMEQIFTNAIKYTKKGSVSIVVHENETNTEIAISDTGMGIAPEDLPRIFDKGYTGYNGRIDKHSTGIGLYLCKQIIDKLGHDIMVESKLGEGTTVTIIIQCHFEILTNVHMAE